MPASNTLVDIPLSWNAGDVKLTARSTAPSGWLVCDGASYSRTTYADLFAAIGQRWNKHFTADPNTDQLTCAGHGFSTEDAVRVWSTNTLPGGLSDSTTYYARAVSTDVVTLHPTPADATANTNRIDITSAGSSAPDFHTLAPSASFMVPDLQGRSPLGAGQGASLSQRVLGEAGGEEDHILVTTEMPSHSHIVGSGSNVVAGGGDYRAPDSAGSYASASAGNGNAHNNMHPFGVLTFIVKT